MPSITITEPNGTRRTLDVPEGRSIMEGAREAGVVGIPAECGGACACSNCHVLIDDDWIDRVPPIDAMEEDMLDFAPGAIPGGRSRLSCQIRVTSDPDGLVLVVPAEQA